MKNKITDLRNHLFETIEALKDSDHPMEVHRAKAIYETAQTIIESGKLELQFIDLVGKGENSQFFEQPKLVQQPAPARREITANASS
jgi:hypothetical protein